jgi:hypothetical protein
MENMLGHLDEKGTIDIIVTAKITFAGMDYEKLRAFIKLLFVKQKIGGTVQKIIFITNLYKGAKTMAVNGFCKVASIEEVEDEIKKRLGGIEYEF